MRAQENDSQSPAWPSGQADDLTKVSSWPSLEPHQTWNHSLGEPAPRATTLHYVLPRPRLSPQLDGRLLPFAPSHFPITQDFWLVI